ncbi:MAG: hypothetical protein KBS68_01490 [Clostridiales bacterium]|nr:hypothetical protein [Candidatus Crickella merdequi]
MTGIILIIIMLILGAITQIQLKKNGNTNAKEKKISSIFNIIAIVLGITAIVLYFTA